MKFNFVRFVSDSFYRNLILALALAGGTSVLAQGTFTRITFEGPPVQPPGSAYFVQQYYEAGVWFRPLGVVGPGNGFVRARGGDPGWPDNGTAYLLAGAGDSLMFSMTGVRVFDLVSVDLAEFSTLYAYPTSVWFVGYKPDGSSVTTVLVTDGIMDGNGPLADFETFYLGEAFRGVERVEIPTNGWALDNLVLAIPEPSGGMLLGLGIVAMVVARGRFGPLKRSP